MYGYIWVFDIDVDTWSLVDGPFPIEQAQQRVRSYVRAWPDKWITWTTQPYAPPPPPVDTQIIKSPRDFRNSPEYRGELPLRKDRRGAPVAPVKRQTQTDKDHELWAWWDQYHPDKQVLSEEETEGLTRKQIMTLKEMRAAKAWQTRFPTPEESAEAARALLRRPPPKPLPQGIVREPGAWEREWEADQAFKKHQRKLFDQMEEEYLGTGKKKSPKLSLSGEVTIDPAPTEPDPPRSSAGPAVRKKK